MAVDSADALTEATPEKELTVNNETPIELPPLKQLAASIAMTLGVMLLAGVMFTTIITTAKQYSSLPTMGAIQTDNEGNQFYAAQYSSMRQFAYSTEDDRFSAENSYLKDVGFLGTGFYIYTITNALHWTLEFQNRYLGFLVWLPFLIIAAGCSFYYFYFLPPRARSRDSAIFLSTLFSGLHAMLLIVLMFFVAAVSSSFGALYDMPVLNNGGQMIGLMLPGVFVLFMTNIFYGAIVGVVLGGISTLTNPRQGRTA